MHFRKSQNLNIIFLLTLFVTWSCKEKTGSAENLENPGRNAIVALNLDQGGGIINYSKSPHVKLKGIPMGDCKWTDGFWAEKFQQAQDVMVPHMGKLLTGDTGHALNNFKIAAGMQQGEHQGMNWHDGDFYKWMEAAIYIYSQNGDKKILEELDNYIKIIGKAQDDNGYLQTQIKLKKLEPYSERKYHEMYNSGHLMTSACIHYRTTGQTNFLDIAIKNADYLYEVFQPQPKELRRFGFNQTQIMGLVELYRTTRDKKYLDLAELFINMRGKSKVVPDPSVRHTMIGDMTQERTPLRESSEAVGHAVLALYFYAGAADVYAETGEKALIDALDRIWNNVVNKKMFVTGACGQAHDGGSSNRDFVHEAFTIDYKMHNAKSYNETCANICNAMFNYRMLSLKGESKYADIMETVLYNSALSGISADGTHYFYTNPLRRSHDDKLGLTDYATRTPYIPCFCCPPNLVRTIAKMSGWAYSLTDNGIAVNLFGGNELHTQLNDGSEIELIQETQYPWKGNIKISLRSCKEEPFEIKLRIPDWAQGSTLAVNGKTVNVNVEAGAFTTLERLWKKGDEIILNMPMDSKLLRGHRKIEEVRNQAAIKRGPVVYCLESADLPKNTGILDVYLPSDIRLQPKTEKGELAGITSLQGDVLIWEDSDEGMYRPLGKPKFKRQEVSFIPYYAWSNRGEGEMSVWLPLVWK